MFSLMGRLLSQDPDMYSGIIMKNPASTAMLEKRIEIERKILRMIRSHDRRSFKKLFLRAREHFGGRVADEANDLFLRLLAVMKTAYGKNSVILEYAKAHDRPGLLGEISRVFERNKINLTGINFVSFDQNHMQFAVSFGQPKTSEAVRRSLETFESWDSPKITVVG
jgi:predicted amino acid-binding ACT domain protein